MSQNNPTKLIIDGQQRLTALYSIIMDEEVYNKNYNLKKPIIAFNPFTEKFEVPNASIKNSYEWINDISCLFDKKSKKFVKNFLDEYYNKNPDSNWDYEDVDDKLDFLKNLPSGYNFSVIELNSNLDIEDVSEIFVRINSQRKSLNQSDFIFTLMSLYWPEGKDMLEEFSRESRIPSEMGNSPYNVIKIQHTTENLLRSIVGYSFLRGRLKYAYLIL